MKEKNKTTQLKCVAYMRYSSDKQGETSIEYQEEAIKKYAKERNMVLVDSFIDEAYSGTNDRRPAFQKMIAEVQGKPQWKAVLIYDLSRFSRNFVDASAYKALIRDYGIAVISVTENCTEKEPGGFMESIHDIFNAETSRKNAEKTHAGLSVKARECSHCGGKPPLGYDIVNKKLVVNEAEAEIVKTIFDMYYVGYSYQEMADELNAKGLKTKAGKSFTVNSFHDVLKQPKYCGTFVWNRRKAKNSRGIYNNHAEKPLEEQIIVEDGCKSIVDKKVFDAVQEKMKDNKNGTGKNNRLYMLGGLGILKCGNCGRHMTGHVTYSHGKEYLVYRCPNRKAKQCDTQSISIENLNRFVAGIIGKHYFSKGCISELNGLLKGKQDTEKRKWEKSRIKSIDAEIKNLVKTLTQGYSTTVANELRILEKEKTALKESVKKSNIKSISITEENRKKIAKAMLNKLMTSRDVEVRKFLKDAIKEITVDNDGVNVILAA